MVIFVLLFSLIFRSTADLEGFHQHILMYCAKRFAYTPPVYRVRNLLAAIDHNMHANRPNIINKDGSVRYVTTSFLTKISHVSQFYKWKKEINATVLSLSCELFWVIARFNIAVHKYYLAGTCFIVCFNENSLVLLLFIETFYEEKMSTKLYLLYKLWFNI
jgi:hypothetical protein